MYQYLFLYGYNIYIFIYNFIIPGADWNQKKQEFLCSQQSALGTSPSQNSAPACPCSQLGCSFHKSQLLVHIKYLQHKFCCLWGQIFPLQQDLNSFKSSCSLPGHWRGCREHAYSEGFDLYNDAKFSSGKEEKSSPPNSQSLCQNIPNFLRSWNILCCFLGDLFRGCVWNSGRSGCVFCALSRTLPCFPALYHFPVGFLFTWLGQSQALSVFLLLLQGLHPQSYLYLCL